VATASSEHATLRVALRAALRNLDLTLYLHRVGASRPYDPNPGLSVDAAVIDDVIAFLLDALPSTRLTVSFDDGYADAIAYVESRAQRFSRADYLISICPQKLERRAGFRWDWLETLREQGATVADYDAFIYAHYDVATENDRPELRRLADLPQFRLATVEEVRAVARQPNVRLANHTNCHLPLRALSAAEAARELSDSTADFRRLFGDAARDFTFPCGWPGRHFDASHVQLLRMLGLERLHTTRESPYSPNILQPGVVLPRVQLLGTWTRQQMLTWILRRALVFRLRSMTDRRPASAREFPL
jgi:hypothetical protein